MKVILKSYDADVTKFITNSHILRSNNYQQKILGLKTDKLPVDTENLIIEAVKRTDIIEINNALGLLHGKNYMVTSQAKTSK